MIMLRISNLSCGFKDKLLLKNSKLTAEPGNIIRISGDNGIGKSTFLQCLIGLHEASDGTVILNSTDLLNSPTEKCAETVFYQRQKPYDNVLFTTPLQEMCFFTDQNKAEGILKKYNLYEVRNSPVWNLSYGQVKRITFSVMDTMNKELYLLDEPFAGLDRTNAEIVASSVDQLAGNGKIVIIISHNDKICSNLNAIKFEIRNRQFIAVE